MLIYTNISLNAYLEHLLLEYALICMFFPLCHPPASPLPLASLLESSLEAHKMNTGHMDSAASCIWMLKSSSHLSKEVYWSKWRDF